MNIQEAVDGIRLNVNKFNDVGSFNITIELLRELFNGLWAYKQFLNPSVDIYVSDISDFLYKVQRGKITFATIRPADSDSIKRKIQICMAFFAKLLRENPHLKDVELVQEEAIKTAMRPFNLLVVCVGNMGRSPALETAITFVAHELGLQLNLKSCGIFNLLGLHKEERETKPFFKRMLDLVIVGKPVPITEELCTWASLILTAESFISDKITQTFSIAKGKTITAKEFVSGYRIPEKTITFAFDIDDPAFSIQRAKALDAWIQDRKGTIKDFMKQTSKEIAAGQRKQFLYKDRYPEKSQPAEALVSIELVKLSFAIIDQLIKKNYLTTKPEYNGVLRYKLQNLRNRIL